MSDEEQRVAIAEACPFVSDTTDYESGFMYYKDGTYREFDPINDLNATQEAEKILPALPYLYRLGEVVCGDYNAMATSGKLAQVIKATARQRAEAFLRTIGKWRDS